MAEVAGQVQTNADSVEQRFTQLEQRQQQDVAALAQKLAASEQQLTDLKATLDGTESLSQTRRPPATGGDGEASLLTNC
ncbi:GPO family capsid scaffolding protein [Pectobacterium carotovorum]|uniref:GPO family capsid scaffolding protein n=1 Tax=Pectobacterium carotovorum TaxID=554 RepID=UPI003B221573